MYTWLKNITKEELLAMGQNGVDVIRREYAKDVVTDKYVDLVKSL